MACKEFFGHKSQEYLQLEKILDHNECQHMQSTFRSAHKLSLFNGSKNHYLLLSAYFARLHCMYACHCWYIFDDNDRSECVGAFMWLLYRYSISVRKINRQRMVSPRRIHSQLLCKVLYISIRQCSQCDVCAGMQSINFLSLSLSLFGSPDTYICRKIGRNFIAATQQRFLRRMRG